MHIIFLRALNYSKYLLMGKINGTLRTFICPNSVGKEVFLPEVDSFLVTRFEVWREKTLEDAALLV